MINIEIKYYLTLFDIEKGYQRKRRGEVLWKMKIN